VIVEPHDIFGDGVNVAARLEALAEPGGICVSRMVRDNVRDKLDYAFEDLGEQRVKNIARPVRAFALRPEAISDLSAPSVPPALSISQPVGAPRLSIVMLPFANLSNDPEQQYFADGITDDLTTDLSRIAGMLVISHNTALTYRNRATDTKQIGRELGVRYVLEGSVRRSNSQVRVNVQLIDAATDTHLWADRIDTDLGDLFVTQNEITNRLANALGVELVTAEAARPTDNPDALDYVLRGRAAGFKSRTSDSLAEQIALFERALALDPHSVEVQTLLAAVLVNRVLAWMSNSAAADIARAESLINQSLAASPRNAFAHYVKGAVLRAQGRWQEAIPEQEMALASNRNFVGALYELGYCKLRAGSIDEVVALVEQAIRLSPRDPGLGFRYFQIGQVYLLQSRTDQAIAWLEKARSAIPAVPIFRSFLASAYALKGDIERAAAELHEARRLSPEDRFLSIARGRAGMAFPGWGVPKTVALFEATYFAGLRLAGMPEE
jgi:TolB-like protein/Tfp pilus assembly protein PilF